jgi:predicted Zn-dependent peptidase
MKPMQPHHDSLGNGLRFVHQQIDTPVGHCALVIHAGTRDEPEASHGLAHLTEHAIFKGTSRRKAHHILSRLDAVGGELNAYTTKEETVIHASFPAEYLDRAIELMADMAFNSVFPPAEIEKEKSVIIDEIASYQDDPADQIFDDFEDDLFRGDALGRNILGTESAIARMNSTDIKNFVSDFYIPSNMVFSSAGPYTTAKIKKLLERYITGETHQASVPLRNATLMDDHFRIRRLKPVSQAHCIVGSIAYSLYDSRRVEAAMLNNLLAGPPMNTILGMEIREKRGIAYNIESSFTPYTDTGSFMVYFGTTTKNVEKTIAIIYKEFQKLIQRPLSQRQLHMLKRQICGLLLMGAENNQSVMLSNARSLLHFNRIESMEEIMAKIEYITPIQLQNVAADFLQPDRQSELVYLSENGVAG